MIFFPSAPFYTEFVNILPRFAKLGREANEMRRVALALSSLPGIEEALEAQCIVLS